jgi:type II secretory pathway component PulF
MFIFADTVGERTLAMFWTRNATRRFTRQLAMLLEADVPLHIAVELIEHQQKSKRWSRMLNEINSRICEGSSLSRALSCFPRVFSHAYIYTIQWAEHQGRLRDLLIALHFLTDDFPPPVFNSLGMTDESDENLDAFARAVRNEPNWSRRE